MSLQVQLSRGSQKRDFRKCYTTFMNLDDKTKKKIGKRLRESREQKKLTQAEVAIKAGISSSYYARIERGLEQPSLPVLRSLVSILRIKAGDILPF